MKIYRPAIVQSIESFYGALLFDLDQYPIIKDHLRAIALRMWEGLQQKVPLVFQEINNYHQDYLGKSVAELQALPLQYEDCQQTVANQYGFADWAAVEALGEEAYNRDFEQAVNLLLNGELAGLQLKLMVRPELVRQHSQYGHRATLLHYTASNGVELWRQKVPENLPQLTLYLLRQGADKSAKMKVYGGEFTPLPLLQSSAHPAAAGVATLMENLLD